MSVSLKSLPFLVACLAVPVSASMAAAQGTNGSIRPDAATLAAKIDSIVKIDVLAQGMPSVSIVVARGDETLVEHAWGLADVASGRKAEPSTIYQVGSLSKPAAPVVTIENTPSAAAPVGAGKFVGEYEAVPGVLFTVTLENGILFNTPPARTGNPKQYLVHKSGTTFSPGGNESVTPTFVVDTNGEVTEFVARSSGTERTLRRIT